MNGVALSYQEVYDRNHAVLRSYGNVMHKVVLMRGCRLPGFEERGPIRGKRNSAGHASKLSSSLSRTRRTVLELAWCNPWEYFVTLTLSPEQWDRNNLHLFKKALSKWLNNLNYRHGCSIKYLLIPEPHKDGAWHMHGFLMGIPREMLRPFTLQEHLPYRILELLQDGRQVYDWPAYAKKFGYVTCEPIQNQEACANYVVEYITKELEEHVSVLNKKLYLCSQGLNRSQVVLRGHIIRSFVPDFFNEYVAIKKFPSRREALSLFDREDMPGQPLVGFYDIVGPLQKEGPLQKGGASVWTG